MTCINQLNGASELGGYATKLCDKTQVLYTNIDQTLSNKLHGPTHCKIGVTCVYNGHVCYTQL